MLTDSLSLEAPSFLGFHMGNSWGTATHNFPELNLGQLSIEGGHFSPVLSTPGQVEAECLTIHVTLHSGFSSQAQHPPGDPGVPASGSTFFMHWRTGPGQVGGGSTPQFLCWEGDRGRARASRPPVSSCPSGH